MVYRQSPVQLSFESFGCGNSTPISPDNDWVKLANLMPWADLDKAYQLEFPKNSGRAAKPFRMLYGAGLIQQRTGLTDRGVVEAIRDTPAYQYFIGMNEYKAEAPFSYSSLSHFRKRIADILELIRNIINDSVRAKIEAIVPFKAEVEGGEANCPTRRSFLPHSVLKLTPLGERIDQEFQKWHR